MNSGTQTMTMTLVVRMTFPAFVTVFMCSALASADPLQPMVLRVQG
jgi:hypothetical protein